MDIEKFVKELLSDVRVQGAVMQIMESVMDLLGRETQAPQPEIQEEAQPAPVAPVLSDQAPEAAPVPESVSTPEPAPVAVPVPDVAPTQTQKFKGKRKYDFSTYSEYRLRNTYYNRLKGGRPIEPELNAELARRFPGYDEKTQKFGVKLHKTDFTKTDDDSLRSMYNYRRAQGMEIEPEMQAELVRRFPTYDAEKQKFGVKLQRTDFIETSDDGLRSLYLYRKKHGKEIEPELHEELVRRFPTYDAATQKFTGHEKRTTWSHPKPRREYDFASRTDNSLRTALYNRLQKGLPIEPELDAELARRFPTYDAKTQRFTGRKQKSDATAVQPTAPVPAPAPEPQDITPAPAPRKVVPTIVKDLKRSASQPGELHVTLKEVKLTLQDVYNDVLVNGRPILKNHANTQVRTLLDGALLAVYGIATNRSDLPQKPLWLIFNTRLEENRFVSRDKYSGYSTYITSVQETPNRVHAECSNNSTILLERVKYERIAAGSRFILGEKTK